MTQDTEALTVSPMSVPRGGKGEPDSASWPLLGADGGPWLMGCPEVLAEPRGGGGGAFVLL